MGILTPSVTDIVPTGGRDVPFPVMQFVRMYWIGSTVIFALATEDPAKLDAVKVAVNVPAAA